MNPRPSTWPHPALPANFAIYAICIIAANVICISFSLQAVSDLHNGIEKIRRDMQQSCRSVLKWFRNGIRRLVILPDARYSHGLFFAVNDPPQLLVIDRFDEVIIEAGGARALAVFVAAPAGLGDQ